MNNGLVPADWGALFLAAAIAGTALSGLLAVVLGAQVRSIDAAVGGVARAADAVILPLVVGLVGFAGLWPADTRTLVGVAIAVVGIGAWLVVTGLLVAGGRGTGSPLARRALPRLVFGQLTTLTAIAGGALLASSAVPGLDPVLLAVGGGLVGGPFLAALLVLDLARAADGMTPATSPVRATPAAPVATSRPVDAATTDTSRIEQPR